MSIETTTKAKHSHVHLKNSTTKRLRESLKNAVNEKDVENAYRQALAAYFPSKTTSPFNLDGLLECETVRSLLEFKFNYDLTNKLDQCDVLIQSLFYIKKFEQAGKKLPTTVFVGDNNECFCLQSGVLLKYFNHEVDWTIAPSSAAKKHPDLLKAMVDDQDILPFIFAVQSQGFSFGTMIDQIKSLGEGVIHQIKITKDNIIEIFNYWRTHVLTDKNLTESLVFEEDAKAQTARQCDIFFNCLTDKETTYLHPRKKNCLVTRGDNIAINTNQHRSFFSHFGQKLSPSELEIVVANKDRIIDEVSRRRTGSFFTPSLWVAEAQKMIGESLGANWRDEYVVWDCASGTNNLTRDYNFKELYCSTLEQGDVNTVKDCGYNRGSTVFQYDFLSEMELGDKVPDGLRQAFESGKKVLFYINPPYGTAKQYENKNGSSKAGIADTVVGRFMKSESVGASSQQLYAQFLFKIAKLAIKYNCPVQLGLFAPPLFMTGESFAGWRKQFLSSFYFNNGMIFKASNFADVSDDWGISFTVWNHCQKRGNDIFSVAVKSLDGDTFAISGKEKKTFYSPDAGNAAKWVREGLGKAVDAPQMTSAIGIKQEGRGKLVADSIGYMHNNGNNVYHNIQLVGLYSSSFSGAHGFSVTADNFRRSIALYAARKTIVRNWINWQDEYLIPNENNPDYAQWNNDAIVYSLFNAKSNQSSLRNVLYKGKRWNIKNQFFFMSNAEMRKLADKAGFQDMYEDTKAFPDDSYVYKLLQTTVLSNDAQAVLDASKELVRLSMSLRETWYDEHPQHQLQAWDSSYAQLKPMWKEHFKEQFDAFRSLYKAFEDRMRHGVYLFGFLK